MVGESRLSIESIDEVINRKNTGPVIKRIELEILANDYCANSSTESDSDFLKFISRYSSAVDILEQQINN